MPEVFIPNGNKHPDSPYDGFSPEEEEEESGCEDLMLQASTLLRVTRLTGDSGAVCATADAERAALTPPNRGRQARSHRLPGTRRGTGVARAPSRRVRLSVPCGEEAAGGRGAWSDVEQVPVPVYHPTPSQTRLATQLTEEEQIRIAQRIGLIQHLPKGVYDPGRDGSEKKIRECVICMMDFVYGDPIRFLPCMHIYHLDCIDDWLMRSFTCPSCMEPVDAALLSSYETN
nr:PREDICTED: RING finger protein 11 [Apteryx mantelli mantelli]